MSHEDASTDWIDRDRRRILAASGAALVLPLTSFSSNAMSRASGDPIRWGFVGTGGIANSMARVVTLTDKAVLAAVSSRTLSKAEAFAERHGGGLAFDDWNAMLASPDVDAVYVATPTSVREEICVAAAAAGKHVLGEKPFASAGSVRRITAACRDAGVAFMDGTHFVHHPRTTQIQGRRDDETGWPWSVDSAFQFNLPDRGNIRYNTELEPMGAIGDAGWYNMRAAVEYLASVDKPTRCDAFFRRDEQTGAAISGSGLLAFADGATTTWNCGFDSGSVVMDVRITGDKGTISIDDFLIQNQDGSADYLHKSGGWGPSAKRETISVASALPGAALMFEGFHRIVHEPGERDHFMRATEATQVLLDMCWEAGVAKEKVATTS